MKRLHATWLLVALVGAVSISGCGDGYGTGDQPIPPVQPTVTPPSVPAPEPVISAENDVSCPGIAAVKVSTNTKTSVTHNDGWTSGAQVLQTALDDHTTAISIGKLDSPLPAGSGYQVLQMQLRKISETTFVPCAVSYRVKDAAYTIQSGSIVVDTTAQTKGIASSGTYTFTVASANGATNVQQKILGGGVTTSIIKGSYVLVPSLSTAKTSSVQVILWQDGNVLSTDTVTAKKRDLEKRFHLADGALDDDPEQLRDQAIRGDIDECEVWQSLMSAQQQTITETDCDMKSVVKATPGVIDIVKTIAKGTRLQGIFVDDSRTLPRTRAQVLGYDKIIPKDLFIVSGDWGVTKSEGGLFSVGSMAASAAFAKRAANAQFATLPPASILLIDDNPQNIATAQAMGWQALLFTDAVQLKKDLKTQFGINVP